MLASLLYLPEQELRRDDSDEALWPRLRPGPRFFCVQRIRSDWLAKHRAPLCRPAFSISNDPDLAGAHAYALCYCFNWHG